MATHRNMRIRAAHLNKSEIISTIIVVKRGKVSGLNGLSGKLFRATSPNGSFGAVFV